jgi:hypothetical protein
LIILEIQLVLVSSFFREDLNQGKSLETCCW